MTEAIPVTRKCMEYIKYWLARAEAVGMNAEIFAIEDICHCLEMEHWGGGRLEAGLVGVACYPAAVR